MTSSTSAAERRWGSARRSGMTVLGKVAVPKPLNLPSQRLENNGLDPNEEIIPKGTVSWGSRSFSSTTNAWGSSTVSPSADSSANSPSHLSGRPSSGGSGARPSTAGTDRPNEPTGNTWGRNSRPSSASGVLTSNQSSSTSLRPCSAETRPASSHLSRFAESVSDTPGAWGARGTAERLGVSLSKKDEFSLSSGDFPTLGSEKDHPSRSTESKDPGSHARPILASDRVAQSKDKTITSQVDDLNGAVNRWKNNDSQSPEEGVQRSLEKWKGEQQQYFNPNVPPQQFGAWHAPPMNAPAGVWYRGYPGTPPIGPPFGAPVAPGGFPIEQLPYYRTQIPPLAFANSQPVPPPRGGPRGHPKSRNPYRSQIPDAYVRPDMPFRPGFFPATMDFEGYYGPPIGYCNSIERDIPYMGMGRPPVYDRYSAPKSPDPIYSHASTGASGPVRKTTSGDVKFSHSGDAQGAYKLLTKHHNDCDGKEQVEDHGNMPPAVVSHPVKGEKAGKKQRKYEGGAEDDGEEDIYSLHNFDFRDGWGSDTVQAKYSRSPESLKPAGDGFIKKLDGIPSSSLLMPQVYHPTGSNSYFSCTINDATLMHKVAGLNEKARSSDGRADCASSCEDGKCGSDAVNAKVDNSTHKAGKFAELADITSPSECSAPTSFEVLVPAGDSMVQPETATVSSRPYHGMTNRSDSCGKGNSSNQDADGWRREREAPEISGAVAALKLESASNLQECYSHQPVEVAGVHLSSKDGGGCNIELPNATDSQARRAKMRELAKQRAIQLQKEEEERIREQKAKALAKLEELNQRAQIASNQIAKKPLVSGTLEEQEESDIEKMDSAKKLEASNPVPPLETEDLAFDKKKSGNVVGSAISFEALLAETSKSVKIESAPHEESVPLKQVDNAGDGKSAREFIEGGVSRNKQTNYKQKQNNSTQKNLNEKSILVDAMEVKETHNDVAVNDAASAFKFSEVSSSNQTCLPNNFGNAAESSASHRRRNSKIVKNTYKHHDAPVAMETTPSETITEKTSSKNVNFQASDVDLYTGSIHSAGEGYSGRIKISEQCSSLPSERANVKVNNQWKPQHSRRMPRNQQVNRLVDKFQASDAVMWAPVRSQNKGEIKDEVLVEGNQKQRPEYVTSAKCDNVLQNSSKSKRAEMERYVPKSVAKELVQQVGMQQPVSSSVSIGVLDGTASVRPVGSETGNALSSTEAHEGVIKHKMPGKVHGASWLWGTMEISNVKNVQQGLSSTTYPRKTAQYDINEKQLRNPEANSAQAGTKSRTEINVRDSQKTSTSVSKDPGTEKGKHHSYKGRTNMCNNHSVDNKNISSTETSRAHIQAPVPDTTLLDRDITSKETRGTGGRMSSQWQSKNHASCISSQRGIKITGSQNLGIEASGVFKKDYSRQQQEKTPPEHIEESNERDGPEGDQSQFENKADTKVPKVGTHEPSRGRKLASSKGPSYSSNHNPVGGDELAAALSIDPQHEKQFPAGPRRYGNQIKCSGKGHESRGDWFIQDNKWQDAQNCNRHYEYQPVGSHDSVKNHDFEGQSHGSRNAGSRYRERGHSHPKRGDENVHGR